MNETIGVLVMAYGSPNKIEDIPAYYTDIRKGRTPSAALLEDLIHRYEKIGGRSPLLEITKRQAAAIGNSLGEGYKVFVGMRHWQPWIQDAVAEMKKEGIQKAVACVMAPHYSDMSIAQYMDLVKMANEQWQAGIHFKNILHWHNHPLFITALSENIKCVQENIHDDSSVIVFTAHSLPERILQQNDPYLAQLMETAQLIADNLSLAQWRFAFQSAGRTAEKWLGPELKEAIEQIHQEGYRSVIVCPIGFIADHLEILYDIDIEIKNLACSLGMNLQRTESLNDHPLLAKLLAAEIRAIAFNE